MIIGRISAGSGCGLVPDLPAGRSNPVVPENDPAPGRGNADWAGDPGGILMSHAYNRMLPEAIVAPFPEPGFERYYEAGRNIAWQFAGTAGAKASTGIAAGIS